MITIEQIRAARAMLGLRQAELAKKASLSTGTLNNLERGVQTDPKLSTMRAIEQALEAEGIEFIGDGVSSMGICFKPHKRHASVVTVLIVDDNNADRKLFKVWLSKHSQTFLHYSGFYDVWKRWFSNACGDEEGKYKNPPHHFRDSHAK
jgi:transcriptional regulator with XRE-family HTH domain